MGQVPMLLARHRLTDIVRDTLIFETVSDMYRGLKLIEQEMPLDASCWLSPLTCVYSWQDERVKIVELNDRLRAQCVHP